MNEIQRMLLIHNPHAGTHNQSLIWKITRCAKENGVELVVRETVLGPDSDIAVEFPDEEIDAAWVLGGDGTFNAVVNAAAKAGRLEFPFGLISGGTANVLAAEFGMKRSVFRDSIMKVMRSAVVREMDLGDVNGRIFVMSCGSGFDAAVMGGVKSTLKKKFGAVAYVESIVKTAFATKKLPIIEVCHSDGTRRSGNWFIAANASRYAGDIKISNGTMHDGVMECFLFSVQGVGDFARVASNLVRRSEHPDERMMLKRGESIQIHNCGDIQIDGEFMRYSGPVSIAFRDETLRVFTM